MQKIDLANWDRREHYEFFRRSDYAHYHLGTDVEITKFRRQVKQQGLYFSFALTYAVTAVMNQIEAFRYRIRAGEVVLHEQLHPSFTYLAPGEKYFKLVTTPLQADMVTFVQKAHTQAQAQQEYFKLAELQGRDDLIFISSIPKVSFTHLSHTISFNKDDAVPRLSWGKYYEQDGKTMLPLNVQAHHAFVDGDHMGSYFEALQAYFHSY